MFGIRFLTALGASALTLLPHGAGGQDADRSNLWIMWEHVQDDPVCAGNQNCPENRDLRSHVMMSIDSGWASDFFTSMHDTALQFGEASLEHDRSLICTGPQEHVPEQTGMTPEMVLDLPLAKMVDTLRGLDGVHADLRGLRGPPGYLGDFGTDMHNIMEQVMQEADIPILSRENLGQTLGQPRFVARYSPEISGCKPWAIYLSIKQHVLLSRNQEIKYDVVTWSTSSRQDENNFEFTPLDALEAALLKFVADYQDVNNMPKTTLASQDE